MTDLPNYGVSQRRPFIQWLIDFATICTGVIFVCSLACSIPLALFLMFFAQW